MSLTAIILAGGKSSRMGQDKGLIFYHEKRLVEYAVSACKELTSKILISTNNSEYSFLPYKLIPDNYKNLGPIGGIHAALKVSSTEDNLFCPCDMPGISSVILQKIVAESKGKMATVAADSQGKVFPVLGCYKKSALPLIEAQIKKGDYKLQHLLKELNAKKVAVENAQALSNMNFPEDLK